MDDWPWDLCRIDFDRYNRGRDADVDRTPFEDGNVRQAKTSSAQVRVHTFRIAVKQSNVEELEEWFEAHTAERFNFKDFITEETVSALLRGGAGAINLVADQGVLWENERVFRGEVTIEYTL